MRISSFDFNVLPYNQNFLLDLLDNDDKKFIDNYEICSQRNYKEQFYVVWNHFQ